MPRVREPGTSRGARGLPRSSSGVFRGPIWEPFPGRARAVLEELLERYAEYGGTELDDLGGLRIPPLDQLGSPVAIAAQDLRRRLAAVAATQRGYFTAARALKIGYSYPNQ